jgi:hypothetical protein
LLFNVYLLRIPFGTLSEPEEITKFCSKSIFSMIFSVSPVASVSAMKVDAILAILNFQLIPSHIYRDANSTNGLFSIFEPSVAKYLLVLIFSWKIF